MKQSKQMSKKITLNIAGMSCVNCSNAVEKISKKIPGIKEAKVSYTNASGEFVVENDEAINILKAKIKKIGYEVVADYDELIERKKAYIKELFIKFCMAFAISLIIMWAEMSALNFALKAVIGAGFGAICLFYCGGYFFKHGILSLRAKNFDMNVLVMSGSSVAYIYSLFVALFARFLPQNFAYFYFSGASMIICFILLGKFLEENSKFKANDYIKKLIDLSPKKALIVGEDGVINEINADNLKTGDKILIKTGAKIPADAVIIEGEAEIDTSMITGESLPKFCTVKDEINAGCINTDGVIYAKVTKNKNSSLLAQILDLLSEAGAKKMPISRLADKIANIFVPSVIFISVLTFVVWAFVGNAFNGVMCAICVLIISCPCALGLATPVAIVCAISNAAKNGILVRNPEILEILKDARTIVFDKTGTLSKGEIAVSSSDLKDDDLRILAMAEILSEHKISKAIVKFAEDKFGEISKFDGTFENKTGKGIIASNTDISLIAGNFNFLRENGVNFEIPKNAISALNNGFGVIFVAINGEYEGFVSLADEVRDEAKSVVEELKNLGIKTVMLTGDDAKTANFVGKKLGIDEIKAGVLPNEKYDFVQNLKSCGKVIFIGDGINDAPALKAADIGIAMNSGNEIAKGAGDLIFVKNNLKNVLYLLRLSVKTMNTIKQNLFWAFFYNLICIPTAAGAFAWAGILLKPIYGAIAMCFSSVCVVLNSLRLKFMKN